MKVGLLTEQQKNDLTGVMYQGDTYYSPVQDGNGDWIISTQEIEMSEFSWIKNIPLIDYVEPTPPTDE